MRRIGTACRRAGLGALSAMLLMAAGCAEKSTQVQAEPPASVVEMQPQPAPQPLPPPIIFLLDGSADAPPLDVYLGSALVARNLGFGGLVGPIQVAAGVQPFDLFPHMEGTARPSTPPLATLRTSALASEQHYLAVIAGDLTPGETEQPLQLLVYPAAFSTRTPVLRLVNGLSGSPALQAGAVRNDTFLQPVTMQPVAFAGASAASGAVFPAGPVQFGLSPIGAVSPVATFLVNVLAEMRAFVVPIGALSPAAGEQPIRLAVVNTSASPWTIAVLQPR